MKSISFILAALLFVVTACSDDSDKKSCDSPFLDKVNNEKVYYYENGLIAKLTWGREYKFYYSEVGLVTEITIHSDNIMPWDKGIFFYDETDRIHYILRYNADVVVDSIQTAYDDQHRIIKLMHYAPHPEDQDYALYETIEYEYEGVNSTKSTIHRHDGYEQITLTEYDNNPPPFSAEARLINFLHIPFYFAEHNVTRFTYQFSEGQNVSEQEIKYNGDGYPVKVTLIGETVWFSYTCNPRPVEGLEY